MNPQTIRTEFPYPLARRYAFIYERSAGYLDMYSRGLDCLESLVRCCTMLLVCEYVRMPSDLQHPETSGGILDFLRNTRTSIGHWVAALRSLSAHLISHREALFMPELPGLYFERPGRLTTCARQVLESFPNERNQFLAHKKRTYSENDYKRLFEQCELNLAACFDQLQFLTRYAMIVPTRLRGTTVEEWLDARGAGAFEVKRGESIAANGMAPLEGDLEVLLLNRSVAASEARILRVSPFFVYRYWFEQDAEDLYVFGTVATNTRKEISAIQYFGFSKRSEPLAVSSQDHLSVLFDAFLTLLKPLAPAAEQARLRPPGPTTSPYFSIQQTIIDQHTQFYVARGEIDAQVDAFLSSHRNGYCVLIGPPGHGKTALTAGYAARHGWVHHFVQLSDPERRRWDRIVRSLVWQISERFRLETELPLTDDDLLKCYYDTLALAARQASEPVVIVIDALDELSDTAECRLDFLPPILPPNVYFLISSREDTELDMLRQRVAAANVLQEIAVPPLSVEQIEQFFGDVDVSPMSWQDILDISEGSPLFLREIKRAVQAGGGVPRAQSLPTLEYYFAENLDRIGFSRNDLMRRAACTIAASITPIPLVHLARILGERERVVANEALRPMMQYLSRGGDAYAIYHRRFRDFLLRSRFGSDDIADAQAGILAYCEPCEHKGHWYALASAPELLLDAGRYDRVLQLAGSPAFYAALEKHVDYYQMCKRVLELLERVRRASADHAHAAVAATLAFLKHVGHFAHDYELFDLVPDTMKCLEESAATQAADDRAHIYLMKGNRLYHNCRYAEALTAFSTALHALDDASAETRNGLAYRILQLMGLAHRRLTQPAEADVCFDQAAGAAAAVGNLFFQADIWVCLAISKTQQGDFASAEANYARGIAALTDLIARFDEVNVREKEGLKDVLHAKANLASYHNYHALCCIAQDRTDAAADAIARSEAVYTELEGASIEYLRHHYERFLYTKAWVRGLQGRLAEAEELARKSLQRSERDVDRAYALYVLASVLRWNQSRSPAEARAALEQSLTLFSSLGMRHETERARRDLGSFTESPI